ncbi:unnamed protein product, partial [Dovyalis caffra]
MDNSATKATTRDNLVARSRLLLRLFGNHRGMKLNECRGYSQMIKCRGYSIVNGCRGHLTMIECRGYSTMIECR